MRLLLARAPGAVSAWVSRLVLLSLALTLAGGLGLLAGGARPREPLHFVYAILGLGAVPIAQSLTHTTSTRWQAAATAGGAIVGLVLVSRLFQTG